MEVGDVVGAFLNHSAANHSGNKSRQYEAFLTVAQTFASKEADEAFLAALQRILPARNG